MPITDKNAYPVEEWRPGVLTTMHVSALTGATTICMFEQWISLGCGARPHAHPVEEILTALSGPTEFWLDGRWQPATEGHSLVVPEGREHGFRNLGGGTLHLQTVLAAPWFEASYEGQPETMIRWSL